MKVSEHFDREEFECGCGCGFATVDVELLAVLEDLRSVYATPIKINSGCRCEKHNKAVGGEEGSKHMQGIAADIVVSGVSPAKVYQYLVGKYPGKYGLGLYKSWNHIDVRPTQARWSKV
jgi:uncharacterized protein YcbK (DUF882 family)